MATTTGTDYAANWMDKDWIVVMHSWTDDPLQQDTLRFTESTAKGKTIEVWRRQQSTQRTNGTQVTNSTQNPQPLSWAKDWATGCIWSNDSLQGTTADGSYTFTIGRDGSTNTLTCTLNKTTALQRQIGRNVLAAFSGGFAGFLTGVAIGVPAITALAISGIAAGVSTLIRAISVYSDQDADVWVANEGGRGLPKEPDIPTEETDRRSKAPFLRAASA